VGDQPTVDEDERKKRGKETEKVKSGREKEVKNLTRRKRMEEKGRFRKEWKQERKVKKE
jgi:hypothetical protein